ncbi:DNA gyrase subunit A [Canibacter oris]|uniref:DNA topoisomerase (ATP-hydrolyzing) n=2 Tax=Canibacter oris TaxID=1365628 RepID=A0A840DIC1_9MICO|nr:DNA gyrase subunit A [Canibacter oris]
MQTAANTTPERIEDIDITAEMSESFLEYAYSVIYSRALPDARDGLKPVQRRILYMMGEMGLRPDKGHVKSARVVGEVMGKLHPHGDGAIYDTLVRQAQPFSMRQTLVDGHGNFGSLDDGPAASRYTEARLTAAAMAMLSNIEEDVVDFGPNYDNSQQQPLVLPSAFPNLLVNGASGIAVGMATNMAPHNLAEVIAGVRHLMQHPNASLEEIMGFIPGPDFPSGGILVGLDGIKEAYETGRGSVRVRAKATVENVTARRKALVITELPYQVGPEKIIEAVKAGVQSKKIQGISELNDFTDRKNGLKLVITIKTGFSPEAVLEQLYKQTPLEDSFAFNNVCLVNGQPQTLGLLDLLRVYIDHRINVVRRRSQFRLQKHQSRLHLVEGLLLAIADIDEVIQLIRSSENAETAKQRLQQVFDLSEAQAEYILELRLRRLTKFSRIELETERDELKAAIAELTELLADPAKLQRQVSAELGEVAAEFGDDRRTTLLNAQVQPVKSGRATAPLQIADTPCQVLLSATGRMLRVDLPEGDTAVEAAATFAPARRTKHDAVLSRITTSVRAEIAALTNLGRVLRFSPVDLPSAAPNSVQLAAGARVSQYLETLQKKERVVALLTEQTATPLAMGTKQGVVKRLASGEWQKGDGFEVISLKPGDEIVGAAYADDNAELVFVTDAAQLLRFNSTAVRPQGRAAAGMAGIKLGSGQQVIAFNVVDPAAVNLVATYAAADLAEDALFAAETVGSVKLSDFAEFPAKGRATGGVRAQRFLRNETVLRAAWVGAAPIMANGKDGSLRQLPQETAKRDASGTAVAQPIDLFGGGI